MITSKEIGSILFKSISLILQLIALAAGCIFVIQTIVNFFNISMVVAAYDMTPMELAGSTFGVFLIMVDIVCTGASIICVINDYKRFFNLKFRKYGN